MADRPTNNKSASDEHTVLNLDRVVFIGRTFAEYMWMFNLDPSQLRDLKILDCPSGASSFVAEASGEHHVGTAVGCDLLYGNNNLKSLEKRGKKDLEYMLERLSLVPDFYDWNMYTSVEDLGRARSTSLRRFLSDYESKQCIANGNKKNNRYIQAELPKLPFDDKSFDLVLSSNLLFYYHNMLDYSFHLESILELLRVTSKELRIFPVQRPDSSLPDYFDRLMEDINVHMQKRVSFRIEKVKYEFRRGVNKMLVITRGD
jgi:SAM-dependent methyltransferase